MRFPIGMGVWVAGYRYHKNHFIAEMHSFRTGLTNPTQVTDTLWEY